MNEPEIGFKVNREDLEAAFKAGYSLLSFNKDFSSFDEWLDWYRAERRSKLQSEMERHFATLNLSGEGN